MIEIETNKVIYREELYPRSLTSPETVQTYAQDIEAMPPIEINQHNILIDGWHRWTAHKKLGLATIKAIVTETRLERDVLFLAIERNSTHGLQLSREDKQAKARDLYHATSIKDRPEFKKRLPVLFSVGETTVNGWLSRIDKDTKEATKKRVLDLWMACCTLEDIAELVGYSKATISEICSETASLPKSNKSMFQDDFDPPLYNVWKVQDKSNKVGHFGNTEARWLENLLYLYTDPLDVVIDPFAGGGSTIDVCKRRGRRYYVSDRKPIVEREAEIRQWDIAAGPPSVPRWKDVALVYLDPPYWKQAEGQYSGDPEDLANMELEKFNQTLAKVINGFTAKLKGGDPAYIALVMQPTQWRAPDRGFVDHVGDMLRAIKLPVDMRYSVPYESQQCNAQMVMWAKESKRCLVLTREIVVWRVD